MTNCTRPNYRSTEEYEMVAPQLYGLAARYREIGEHVAEAKRPVQLPL